MNIIPLIVLWLFVLYSNKHLYAQKTNSNNIDASIQLPKGFVAVIFADNIGSARHISVTNTGVVYVKLRSLKNGKGIVKLVDTDKDNVADKIEYFADYRGTGIANDDKHLYASSSTSVYRYDLDEKGNVIHTDKPEIIVKDLVDKRQHNAKSITLDEEGNIYVNIGAPSNSCQENDRQRGSLGIDPCPILKTAGGIWKFNKNLQQQSYKEGERYATGLRNVVGLDWSKTFHSLYVMQHGRDQLSYLFPELYTDEQNAELPAEEFFKINQGDDCGWPYCYYDGLQNKKVLAPEYGGDGKKQDKCLNVKQPIAYFPAHMAPNAVVFYHKKSFPKKYHNGAFIAWHGSWNRAPLEQKGFYVSFTPFGNDGLPKAKDEVFAKGFAGKENILSTSEAKYRPCGLAVGPHGALYISEDNTGRIWKIIYNPINE